MVPSPATSADSSSSFRAVFRRALLAALALLLLLYLFDSLSFQLRLHYPAVGRATGSVHRIRLLAIPGKANKVQYQIDALQPEEDLPCAQSLFPHAGLRPCWYVTRHASDPIPM
jgi:hypothetical protein